MGGRAVFLDRDGVINANIFYADTGEVEAPRTVADFTILPGVLEAMQQLQDAGFLLFVVSNQPNQAKRKATRADHDAIQAKLAAALDASAWPRPPLFDWLQREGKVADDEMHRVFNCGIGMVVIVAAEQADAAVALLRQHGEEAQLIGDVRGGQGNVLFG